MPIRPLPALLLPLLASLFAVPAAGQDLPPDLAPPPQGFVTMAGSGTAPAVPEVATVRLVVAAEGASFRQAFEAGTTKAAAVVAALAAAGVPQSQVRSERFQAAPARPGEAGAPFRVRHTMTARIRGFARLGDALERAASAGAIEAAIPELLPDDAAGALREARTRAARDAEERAKAYAAALGVELGRIVSIAEAEPDKAGAGPAPEEGGIDLGRGEVRAAVTVVWEIAPRPR